MSLIEWISVVLLLGHAPFACYFDLKYRELPKGFWSLIVVICPILTVAGYLSGIYPVEGLFVSGAAVLCILAGAIINLYEGADFWFLAWIAMFFVTNPISGHSLMIISYAVFLVVSWIAFAIAYQFPIVRKQLGSPTQFPAMLPISLALILTVILG